MAREHEDMSATPAIEGVEVAVGTEAVVVTARHPLTVVSSAVVGGGFGVARSIVNVHVPKNYPWETGDRVLGDFVERRGLPTPFVGLLTSAWTERAEMATASGHGIAALVVATIGLGNAVSAGRSVAAPATASTINTIVVANADVDPAALVNLVITVTEVKALVLAAAGVRDAAGAAASGTSTDAVVVAATGQGPVCRFGGPISPLGWVVARATRDALEAGVRRWLEQHR
jgi:iron complex transport system ATP-binding protein